jgi:hypothetical protein
VAVVGACALLGCAGECRPASQPSAAGPAESQPSAAGGVAFPLRVSANRRHLVDRAGKPFLINQASSWSLIQALSREDAAAYLDALAAREFNTVLVSVISYDKRHAGDPPRWQGIEPLRERWDFSTFDERYFEHADDVIRMARERGMLVLLVPVYLGPPHAPDEGFWDELLSPSNSVAKSAAYGRFLGQRYREFDNLVWVMGGDHTPPAGSELETHLRAVVDGIRERDRAHLWTAHWFNPTTGFTSLDNPSFAAYIDLNGYYAYDYDLTYQIDLRAYAQRPVRPFFHLDMSYEHEPGGSPDNIRRKAYGGMLDGAAGSSFCAGPEWYTFYGWRNMDTVGTRETTYWYRLFRSRPWHELVPDSQHEVLTDGYGHWGETDYVSAARTRSGFIAYLPSARWVTIDLRKLAAMSVNIYWYDPTTGSATFAGEHPNTDPLAIAPPRPGSWALVIDDAARRWPAPGR